MSLLSNSDDLLKAFGNIQSSGYVSPTPLTDTKVGFSVQHVYPSTIRYKPAKTTAGTDDNVAVIWVVYEETRADEKRGLVPLRLRISMLSKFRTKFFDYDFKNVECPTEESLRDSLASKQPIEISSVDYYFYSTSKNAIVDSQLEVVDGVTILNALFQAHCDTVHLFKGLPTRSKLVAQNSILKLLSYLIDRQNWILKKIFGYELVERLDRNIYLDGYTKGDLRVVFEPLTIFGYKTSKNIAVLFSLIVAIAAWFLLPADEGSHLERIFDNQFLLLIHSIIVLWLLEGIPLLLFQSINICICMRKRLFNYLLRR